MEKVKSEKGFTLLELIFVTVVIGTLSSTLVLPFASSMKRGTQPEIYNTATYLAVDALEWRRSDGYSNISGDIDTNTNPYSTTTPLDVGSPITRRYDVTVVSQYVSHSAGSFNFSSTPTEIIKVTVTVSNTDIPYNVEMNEILTNDFYNINAN